jgi:SpoIIAA-like
MQTPAIKRTGNILSIRIDSSLSDNGFRAISTEIDQLAAAAGKIRLVLVIKHYASLLSAEDLLDDMRFVRLYSDRIDKVAVVSDTSWKRTWVGLFSLFSGVKMEFFDMAQYERASNWIQTD